jgi:hypothetical protein
MSHDRFISRREALKAGVAGACGAAASLAVTPGRAEAGIVPGSLPHTPLEIGREPQFLFDLHTVDCTWSLREKQAPVRRVFHSCKRHGDAPLLTGDDPSHFWVVRDDDGKFRLWYQLNRRVHYPEGRQPGQAAFESFMAYAESDDGLAWVRPELNLFKEQTELSVPANCVLYRPKAARNAFDTPQIVEAPESDRRGYRYLMFYLGTGPDDPRRALRLVGSHDGVRWDLEHDQLIARIGSDHHNCIVYDPRAKEYVMYLRAKHIYLAPGLGRERIDSGQSRRGVARMTSQELWTEWTDKPQTILVPDEIDADNGYNHFYGMPTQYYAGIYWGFLQSFRLNDYMHSELAFSRDGVRFERLPSRPKIVDYGPDGTWDDTMVIAPPHWIEVGDEWWVYYCGWDGPHETVNRNGGIGLAKLRKEGFISLRGPAGGGVVCTRELRWPGGDLAINADASQGELRVRVSDALRKPIAGYNYEDGAAFTGDATAHTVRWGDKSLDTLKGQVVRLEFFLKDADLYTFRAME